jgi:hypothetical protein
MPQKIQPVGFAGRRDTTTAPTVGQARESNAVETARIRLGLSGGTRKSGVRTSSNRLEAISTTHSPHKVQANRAVRTLAQKVIVGAVVRSAAAVLAKLGPNFAVRRGLSVHCVTSLRRSYSQVTRRHPAGTSSLPRQVTPRLAISGFRSSPRHLLYRCKLYRGHRGRNRRPPSGFRRQRR